jgi:hypothetical protein
MIRVTLLYNLPETTDEAEFLKWRLGEHQVENAAMPGVVRTEFASVIDRFTLDDAHAKAPYRFVTTVDYPDRETFEKYFYAEPREEMEKSFAMMHEPVFLITEVLTSTENPAPGGN